MNALLLGGVKLKSKAQQAPLAPVAVQPVPQPVVIGSPGTATLRNIADKGTPNSSFYLAANQSLVNALKHTDASGTLQEHTPHFKNMVATIILETAKREPGQDRADKYANRLAWTIEEFNSYRKSTQLAILDHLWLDCYQRVSPSTLAANMMDGELSVDSGKSLPSSIRRVDGSAFFTAITAGPEQNAWKKWQIGFRIDGGKGAGSSTRDDLPRITSEGSKPLQKCPDLAVTYVQKYYHEHCSSRTTDIYIGYQNRDLYNESGTCVSRSLFGATAFPYRNTQNNTPGLAPDLGGNLEYQYLFAINCAGQRGVDTEEVQVSMGKASLWRPGEKGFAGFTADRILGWTAVVKMGQPQSPSAMQTGWSFKFVDAKWHGMKVTDDKLETYLNAELDSWQPNVQYNIEEKYDFLVNRS